MQACFSHTFLPHATPAVIFSGCVLSGYDWCDMMVSTSSIAETTTVDPINMLRTEAFVINSSCFASLSNIAVFDEHFAQISLLSNAVSCFTVTTATSSPARFYMKLYIHNIRRIRTNNYFSTIFFTDDQLILNIDTKLQSIGMI